MLSEVLLSEVLRSLDTFSGYSHCGERSGADHLQYRCRERSAQGWIASNVCGLINTNSNLKQCPEADGSY